MAIARNAGVELAYDVEGSGPDLLLIAGTASTRPLWTLVRPVLAQSFRTIAFDPRDSGESTIVNAPYAADELAADALAVLDAAGAQRAHVLGHSMGGTVAQQLALERPERLASLTLVCTWARGDAYVHNVMGLMADLTRGLRDDRTLLEAIIFAGAGLTTLRTSSLSDMTDAAMSLGPLAPRDALERQWQYDATVDLLDRLGELRVPTHVICGAEDRLLPAYFSEQLAAAIPDAAFTRLDNVGHVPMVHAPEAFVDAVVPFLKALESTAASRPMRPHASPAR